MLAGGNDQGFFSRSYKRSTGQQKSALPSNSFVSRWHFTGDDGRPAARVVGVSGTGRFWRVFASAGRRDGSRRRSRLLRVRTVVFSSGGVARISPRTDAAVAIRSSAAARRVAFATAALLLELLRLLVPTTRVQPAVQIAFVQRRRLTRASSGRWLICKKDRKLNRILSEEGTKIFGGREKRFQVMSNKISTTGRIWEI